VACQHCIEQNLICRVYHPAFYTKRSLGAICGECRLTNSRCELPAHPKKPHKSCAGRGRSRGLGRTAPPSAGGEMGGKKGERGGSSGAKSAGLISA